MLLYIFKHLTRPLRNKRAAANSTYPKVAVHWLNQVLGFYQSSCLVDNESLCNPQLCILQPPPPQINLLPPSSSGFPSPYQPISTSNHHPIKKIIFFSKISPSPCNFFIVIGVTLIVTSKPISYVNNLRNWPCKKRRSF